jgi:hypothetical protein
MIIDAVNPLSISAAACISEMVSGNLIRHEAGRLRVCAYDPVFS